MINNKRHVKPCHWTPYLFIGPFFFLFVFFGAFPLLLSLYLSFHNWDPANGFGGMKFAGWDNFKLVLEDPWYWASLTNTFWLAIVSGVPQHLVAIPLAYFIHISIKRGRNAVLGIYFLPYITSTVAIALIFSTLFSTDFGVINVVLNSLARLPFIGGLFPSEKIDWLNRADYLKPAVALVVFWRYTGFNTILYLTALQAIPTNMYEAAAIDGATKWQQFRYVTLPLLRPMILFAATLSVIGGLQLFDEPFILTNGGGTDQAAATTSIYLFRTAFEFNEFGTASAIAWLLFVITAVLIGFAMKFFSHRNPNFDSAVEATQA